MKNSLTGLLFVTSSLLFASCTKDAQVVAPAAAANPSELLSYKTTIVPTIDGAIDAQWGNATVTNISATVPDPGANGLFAGYIGENYAGTIRSMYDATNIYFLVEVKDADKNTKATPWYFNTTTNLWVKDGSAKVFDASGILTRDGFGSDQLAFLFNIDNSTAKFATQTCYASCHIFSNYVDYSTGVAVLKPYGAPGANHYTNGANEKIDMWWTQPNRGQAYGKMDDNYQDWAGGPTVTSLVGNSGNGRKLDGQVVTTAKGTTFPFGPVYSAADPTNAGVANTQNLKLDGTGTLVAVPKFIIPSSTADFLKAEDTITGGAAKRVLAVSSAGVLSLEDGSTLDPKVGTDYQRLGTAANAALGAKCIPSQVVSNLTAGRADISLSAVYTGAGWVYEIKRALKTTDVLKQDVDFTSLADFPFGLAIWNRSNYQHGLQTGLLLKFQK
ncbi:MAG: hypothetical protein RLZ16_284 [Bacteroidota bacterium]